MKRLALAAWAAAVLVPGVALACGEHASHMASAEQSVAPAQEVKVVTVDQVAALRKANLAQVVDVNTAETRNRFGIIPGATMLSSATRFDPAKELPASKESKLVFYCANQMCGASHMAAERAAMAGYTDVSVMPAGIMGWKQAGQSVGSALKRI
jgi:rhodanese-related sulfurtransferase